MQLPWLLLPTHCVPPWHFQSHIPQLPIRGALSACAAAGGALHRHPEGPSRAPPLHLPVPWPALPNHPTPYRRAGVGPSWMGEGGRVGGWVGGRVCAARPSPAHSQKNLPTSACMPAYFESMPSPPPNTTASPEADCPPVRRGRYELLRQMGAHAHAHAHAHAPLSLCVWEGARLRCRGGSSAAGGQYAHRHAGAGASASRWG